METTGWLFDLYPRDDGLALWFLTTDGGLVRLTDAFAYTMYATGPAAALARLADHLGPKGWLARTYYTEKQDLWQGRTRTVLALELAAHRHLPRLLAHLGTLDAGLEFAHCDLNIPAYYLYCRGLFPCVWYDLEAAGERLAQIAPREEPFSEDVILPPLRRVHLGLARDHLVPLGRGNGLVLTAEGRSLELAAADVPTLLAEFSRQLERFDPDLILSDWGDEHILPRLWEWSRKHRRELSLDREARPPDRGFALRGRSYFSYGRIVYQGPAVPLYGRWHVDRRNSFFYRETGLEGLAQLARLGQMPLQQVARTSPGTLITSMQLARAVADGILIPWRKGEPERFKSAADLLTADKGGLVFQPPTGLFTDVAEIDFASMYPTIMAVHNISPETVDCDCCADAPRVPEDNYRLCQRRDGLVPRTLRPILNLRARLKSRAQTAPDPDTAATFKARQTALKWILVTCFGYLGYKNARFGRIEAHEAVTAFGRDKLLTAKEICEARDYTILHGLTDCLWITKEPGRGGGQGAPLPGPPPHLSDLQDLCNRITAATGVVMALEGVYRWVVFLPSRVQAGRSVANRYYGVFVDGTLKYRGLMCRRRDTPPVVGRLQEELLGRLSRVGGPQEIGSVWGELQEVAAEYRRRLGQGRVEAAELVITKVLSRPVERYRVETHTALAARQLQEAGIRLAPGEKVRYVVRDRQGPPETRVLAVPFLDDLDRYDTEFYLELLERGVEEVLGPWRLRLPAPICYS